MEIVLRDIDTGKETILVSGKYIGSNYFITSVSEYSKDKIVIRYSSKPD